MAKGREVISTFHGGMIKNKAPRDLDKHESVEVVGLSTMEVGSLISANQPLKVDSDAWEPDSVGSNWDMEEGYGYFSFETDYNMNTNGAAPSLASTTITASVYSQTSGSPQDTVVEFRDTEDHDADKMTTTTTWADDDGKPSFYAVNGAVRFSDAVLGHANNVVLWLGICSQKFQDDNYFGGGSAVIQWRMMANDLPNPNVCLSGIDATDVTPATHSTIQNGKGFGLHLAITSGETEGKWATGEYTFAASNIYLEGQESKLTEFNTTLTINDSDRNEYINPTLYSSLPSSTGLSNAARQTGGRIYYRRNNRSWKLFLDFDYVKGVRPTLDSEYTTWTANSGGYKNSATINVKEPYPITYESLNGHRSGDVTSLTFGNSAANAWKTAVVAQSRAWVANVAYSDENGVRGTMGDRILYTPPNKYDTFPNTYWLDIGASDGEDFTVLQEHSGFLFAFKSSTLYIINIQSPVESGWRVQNKLPHYGVSLPAAVCKTKDGIYWVNSEGVYLWQAGKISEISLKVYPTITSDLTDNSMIGYDVVNREIVIRADGSATNTVMWIFHTPTQSWYKDTLPTAVAAPQSNFGHKGRKLRWLLKYSNEQFLYGRGEQTDVNAANENITFSLTTKDIDFGNVGVNKKVYAFTITYSVTEAGVALKYDYAINGGALGSNVEDLSTITADPSPQRIVDSNFPLICQSFQLKIYAHSSTINAIKIEDISIEYRLLSSSKVD